MRWKDCEYRPNKFFSKRTKNRANQRIEKWNRWTACVLTSIFRHFDRECNEMAKCIRVRLSREPGNPTCGIGREATAVRASCGARRNFSSFDPIFHVLFTWLFIWRGREVRRERVPRYYGRRRGLSTPWLVRSPGVWWFNGTVEREMRAFPAGPQLSAVVLCRAEGKELSGNSSKRDSVV